MAFPTTTTPGRRRRTGSAVVAALALLFAACGGSDDDPAATVDPDLATSTTAADGQAANSFGDGVTVVVPNSPGTLSTTGSQRVMVALIGEGPNAYLGGPETAVTVRYAALDAAADDVSGEVPGEWLTTNASALGLYVAPFRFEVPGLWELTVLSGTTEVGGALLEVVETSVVPNVGDEAPKTASPTGSTPEELAAISTDPEPDPDLYDLSLDEALANGRPTLIAFATPAFCRTALCGPTMDTVKAVAAGRDDLDVVHVEPFDLELAPTGVLEPLPIMFEWNLVTEPWVFVVDADGVITATFEGIIGDQELRTALDQL